MYDQFIIYVYKCPIPIKIRHALFCIVNQGGIILTYDVYCISKECIYNNGDGEDKSDVRMMMYMRVMARGW